jgi:hypothetical protein
VAILNYENSPLLPAISKHLTKIILLKLDLLNGRLQFNFKGGSDISIAVPSRCRRVGRYHESRLFSRWCQLYPERPSSEANYPAQGPSETDVSDPTPSSS